MSTKNRILSMLQLSMKKMKLARKMVLQVETDTSPKKTRQVRLISCAEAVATLMNEFFS
jgi:hypothetical protein